MFAFVEIKFPVATLCFGLSFLEKAALEKHFECAPQILNKTKPSQRTVRNKIVTFRIISYRDARLGEHVQS